MILVTATSHVARIQFQNFQKIYKYPLALQKFSYCMKFYTFSTQERHRQ